MFIAAERVALTGNATATYRELSTETSGIAHYYVEIREAR